MKKKSLCLLVFVLVIVIIVFISIERKNPDSQGSKNIEYKTDYYSIQIPSTWQIIKEADYLTTFYYNNNKIASIETNPECQYCSSSSSIITNLFGLHGSSKGDVVETDKGNYQIVKTIITYKQSAAEQERSETKVPDELHYLFTDKKSLLIDLYLNDSQLSDDEQNEIAQSLSPIIQ